MLSLLHKEVQEFIIAHEQDDERKLILAHKEILGVPSKYIAEQISARRKARIKLPVYYQTKDIIYPPSLNLEQCSSERTAVYKSEILSELLNRKSLVDLAGGFGVDTFFLSKIFEKTYHVEPDSFLQGIAVHNHNTLGAKNIFYSNITAESFLKESNELVDCIFIDPSRRTEGKKVFRFADCEPNLINLISEIFKKTEYVLIKTSPLLDIQQGVLDLKSVKNIWVVAVENECKELLFLCQNGFLGEPEIKTINLQKENQGFSFYPSVEREVEITFSKPLRYLYEPNAAILKAGAFKLIGKEFNVIKLHPNTHLYTSNEIVSNFPGRIFKIIQGVKTDPKNLKEIFPDGKANIITRNYPLSAEDLKKKTKIIDGGNLYLIAFSGQSEKFHFAAERLK